MRRYRGWLVAGAALVALLVVAGLMGGFAASAPDEVEAVAPGTTVDVRPFEVRVDGARAAYEVGSYTADEEQVYVVVEARLRLDARESVGGFTVADAFTAPLEGALDLAGDPTDRPDPMVLVAGDGSSLSGIGPGLTYDVLLVYTVLESAVPDAMTLDVNEHARRRSALDDNLGWFDPAAVARVSLDVAPLDGERPEEEF